MDPNHPRVSPRPITQQAPKPATWDRLRCWHFASLVVRAGFETATFGLRARRATRKRDIIERPSADPSTRKFEISVSDDQHPYGRRRVFRKVVNGTEAPRNSWLCVDNPPCCDLKESATTADSPM